jgi:pre-mRNA-splicing factor SYF2
VHAEADIDYINDANAKFNQKIQRFFGESTSEIKQSLERGTAL